MKVKSKRTLNNNERNNRMIEIYLHNFVVMKIYILSSLKKVTIRIAGQIIAFTNRKAHKSWESKEFNLMALARKQNYDKDKKSKESYISKYTIKKVTITHLLTQTDEVLGERFIKEKILCSDYE
jgi:GTP cyclohydrolase II